VKGDDEAASFGLVSSQQGLLCQVSHEFISSERKAWRALIERLEHPPAAQADFLKLLASAGEEAYKLLPPPLVAALRELSAASSLEIECRSTLIPDVILPWLPVRGKPLREHCWVYRLYRPVEPRRDLEGSVGRIVFFADPQGKLPAWDKSAHQLHRLATGSGPGNVVTGKGCTRSEFLQALGHSGCGLVHFSGDLSEEGLEMADGPLALEELTEFVQAPSLVVLAVRQSDPTALLGRAWARSLIRAGCGAVLFPLREPEPGPGLTLMEEFYSQASRKVPLETALHLAQGRSPANTYVLWAERSLPFAGLRPRRPSSARTQDSEIRPLFFLAVTAGPEVGRAIPIYPLEEGRSLVLGGPGEADIHFEDPRMARRAAQIVVRSGAVELRPLDGAVALNGEPVAGAAQLQEGAVIRVGGTELRFQWTSGEAPAPEREAPGRFALRVEQGAPDDVLKEFALDREVASIGRHPDCDFQLADPAISRTHCSVLLREGVPVLTRVSSGATVVNGLLVDSERQLRAGDLIQLGKGTLLRVIEQ